MITKEIDIKVNTGDAEKDVKSLDKSIEGIGSAGKESGEKASKGIEKVDKTAKATEKSSKLAGLGVKLIGTALKAVGIGVILALFAKFTQILTSNKKVSDAISTTFETVSIVLTEVVTALVNSFTAISDATNGFEGFRKVIGGVVTLGLTPMKLGFFAIKLALQEAQLAFEESIFGDGDQTTIDALNIKIKQTQKDLSDVAAEALIAGKQVSDNVGKAITEVNWQTVQYLQKLEYKD